MDDRDQWHDVPEDQDKDGEMPGDELNLPGQDWEEDLPDDFEDVPEPLDDEGESSLGGTTDPRASQNRRDGLKKDEARRSDLDTNERQQ